MNYSSPAYGVPAAVPAKRSSAKIALIIVGVVIGVFVVLGAIAIALGVGLGLGLHINDRSSSTLSAPTVTCKGTTDTIGQTCGCPLTSPTFSSRIFNGQTANTNGWPWMVVVNTPSRTCSGFIISYQHVITAANCVYNVNINSITVYLGTNKISDTTNRITRGVSNVSIPSAYSSSIMDNDIAVLKLNQNLTFGNTVAACCFANNTALPAVGEHAVITGWGQISLISGISDSLKQAVVQVKDPSACSLSSTTASTLCAGYGTVQTCSGDNGGPLMTSTNNSWTCSGVIIGGSGTCYSNTHYTRVAFYYDFIKTATGL